MIGRIPIRWRLAIVFAVAMAVLLFGAGVFLRVSLSRNLEAGVEQSLRIRSDEAAAFVLGSGGRSLGEGGAGRVSDADESFAQLLDPDGGVLDASSALLRAPLLDADTLRRARAGVVFLDAASIPGADGRSRLLARSLSVEGAERIVIVGISLDARDEAVGGLVPLLLVAGPIALLLASALGYAVAAGALRPVEALRREAEAITGSRAGARLPVSRARDELRDLGETLNAMLGRIDAALQRERDFVADAGHELRTPVAILKAEIDLALMGERSAQELRAALISGQEETERLARLSDDLLALARMQRGAAELRAERVGAGDLLEGVRRRFQVRADAAGRAIEVRAATGVEVEIDRARIDEALGNLVDNSLRHGAGTIRLEAVADEGGRELSVADDGPGIDPEFAGRAFERFTRPDSGRSGGGAGLGLAIVRAVARMHGGEAQIDTSSSGARVTIRLP
jgi:signal transduction histidine kinase